MNVILAPLNASFLISAFHQVSDTKAKGLTAELLTQNKTNWMGGQQRFLINLDALKMGKSNIIGGEN